MIVVLLLLLLLLHYGGASHVAVHVWRGACDLALRTALYAQGYY
jgi:hypothetical protein